MSILPKNERKVAKEIPRNFVIFGGTMHGKTYFADQFPNPLNLNTDGNAEMIETPSITIRNERGPKGDITTPASELLIKAITELEAGKHTYEDRKSTRLNSSHVAISYAVFCLKKKK